MPVYTNFSQLSYLSNELDNLGLVQEYNEVTETEPPAPPSLPYMETSIYDSSGKEEQIVTISDVSDLGVAEKIIKTQPSGKLPPIDGSLLTNITLNQISDVVITGATLGQVVKYDGFNWINDNDAGGALSNLSDTNINAPLDNQTIKFNTAVNKWINEAVSYNELSSIPLTFTPSSHNHIKADITDFTHNHVKADITDFTHTLESHSDVTITAVANNDILQYNSGSSQWLNSTPPISADGLLSSHSDVDYTPAPTAGAYLYYTGSLWIPYQWLHGNLLVTANQLGLVLVANVQTELGVNITSSLIDSSLCTQANANHMRIQISPGVVNRLCMLSFNHNGIAANDTTMQFSFFKNGVVVFIGYSSTFMKNGEQTDITLMTTQVVNGGDIFAVYCNASSNTTYSFNGYTTRFIITEL